MLRFVERRSPGDSTSSTFEGSAAYEVLPGLVPVPAEFDGTASASFADHWVSNVVDRVSFLATLEDTLGFTPKVTRKYSESSEANPFLKKGGERDRKDWQSRICSKRP